MMVRVLLFFSVSLWSRSSVSRLSKKALHVFARNFARNFNILAFLPFFFLFVNSHFKS